MQSAQLRSDHHGITDAESKTVPNLSEVGGLASHVGTSDDVEAGGLCHVGVIGLEAHVISGLDDWVPPLHYCNRPCTMSYFTLLSCAAVLCCAVLCCAVLCCAVLCCAVLWHTTRVFPFLLCHMSRLDVHRHSTRCTCHAEDCSCPMITQSTYEHMCYGDDHTCTSCGLQNFIRCWAYLFECT